MKLSNVQLKIEKKNRMNRNSKNCLNESEMNSIYQLDMAVIMVKLMGDESFVFAFNCRNIEKVVNIGEIEIVCTTL